MIEWYPMAYGDASPQNTVTATSVNPAVANVAVKNAGSYVKVRIVAPAGQPLAFFRFDTAAGAASITSADTPFLPGAIETFLMLPNQTNIGVLAASGTATLYVTILSEA